MSNVDDLWDWCVKTYAAPDVKDAVLALQDQFGAHVPLLLWAAHEAKRGRRVHDADALDAKRQLAPISAHTRALRDARRQAPVLASELPQDLVDKAKAQIAEAELSLERLELARLAGRLSAVHSGDRTGLPTENMAAALSAVGIDLNTRDARVALERLAQAIAGAFTA